MSSGPGLIQYLRLHHFHTSHHAYIVAVHELSAPLSLGSTHYDHFRKSSLQRRHLSEISHSSFHSNMTCLLKRHISMLQAPKDAVP